MTPAEGSPHVTSTHPTTGETDQFHQIDHGARRVTLRTQTTAASAPCPACATSSRRVHGAYWRSLGDVACFGRPTLLLVRVRRFRCTAPACPPSPNRCPASP